MRSARAIDGVIEARPDAVVVAGDLFHSVRPTNAAIVFAFRQFQRLREALPEAPVVLIAGNHDTPRSTETGSILRLFEELGVDVASDEARRFVYPALDLSVLAVPHQALIGRHPARRSGRRGTSVIRCWCCTARSKASSPSTAAPPNTAGRSLGLQELAPDGVELRRPRATTTCSTRWRRASGTRARSST